MKLILLSVKKTYKMDGGEMKVLTSLLLKVEQAAGYKVDSNR